MTAVGRQSVAACWPAVREHSRAGPPGDCSTRAGLLTVGCAAERLHPHGRLLPGPHHHWELAGAGGMGLWARGRVHEPCVAFPRHDRARRAAARRCPPLRRACPRACSLAPVRHLPVAARTTGPSRSSGRNALAGRLRSIAAVCYTMQCADAVLWWLRQVAQGMCVQKVGWKDVLRQREPVVSEIFQGFTHTSTPCHPHLPTSAPTIHMMAKRKRRGPKPIKRLVEENAAENRGGQR
jgi:hypothetical protein